MNNNNNKPFKTQRLRSNIIVLLDKENNKIEYYSTLTALYATHGEEDLGVCVNAMYNSFFRKGYYESKRYHISRQTMIHNKNRK